MGSMKFSDDGGDPTDKWRKTMVPIVCEDSGGEGPEEIGTGCCETIVCSSIPKSQDVSIGIALMINMADVLAMMTVMVTMVTLRTGAPQTRCHQRALADGRGSAFA